MATPDQGRYTVTAHVGRKLSFSSKDGPDSGSDEEVPVAQTSALKGLAEVSPLPAMPDLSQKTSSQPSSSSSPVLPPVPSAASHVSHFAQNRCLVLFFFFKQAYQS